MQRVHLVSLGCSKNRVDSEVMVGTLLSDGFELVDDPESADVVVVNTCSFIQPATEESIDTVLGFGELKERGTLKKLVVTGCMVQRYGAALESELPEVDHFLGTGEYHRIAQVLKPREGQAPRSHVDVPMYIHDEFAPRLNSWSACSAYLKISEGCDHTCAFCIIPQLRGKLRSRTIPSLVSEAERLAGEGIKELNLISQDSTAYGRDLRDGTDLGGLMRALARIDGIEWIRLHYAYPHGVPKSFLEAMAEEPKLCRYVDIPLQHASGAMLKAMRRGVTRAGQERILERLRSYVPNVTLRSTFIVGFPGETERDFLELCDFLEQQRFDHVGVFTYFAEEGTPAATLPDQVPDEVKQERQERLMTLQAQISRDKLRAHVGTEVDVLVEGFAEESELILRGRTRDQAPDVDGQVYILNAPLGVRVGQIRRLRVDQTADYDLVGELVDVPAGASA
ncbi:MAG: 30S ribosomal protein S12 methylthiotransferase RimO [Deltaproteobacteria bacterium]|nr:MAG: 30S ribosomal protein S12 methylthiotransferase RimO [Deltaproteobacteria bacterium]